MLQINERSIEAIAALLYNSIYDLNHPTEGSWCIENRHGDPAYLAFAESLLQAIRNHPDASNHDIIETATLLTNQNGKAGLGWQTIVINQNYVSLPEKAEEVLPDIRAFITDPIIAYHECDFLDLDLDLAPSSNY
ncbi:MAG TPA: hypothetical protein VFA10_27225 [Ktedonobacteraceae bacterium]|nr:hypothetical protein [Ktedonobacteraceae bacterium]